MPTPDTRLTELGTQFLAYFNGRDFAAAAELYAPDATYTSASLIERGHADGCIAGRDQIISYFKDALAGDNSFRLSGLDQFTGLNVAVVLSSTDGHTFIDILRTNDEGLIVEHLEVVPKSSPVDYRQRS